MIAPLPYRPRIGISGKGEDSASVQAMARMVEAAGGQPILLVGHAERIRKGVTEGVTRDLATLDALIIMGNDYDIDPRKYGQGLHPATRLESDTARAAYEEEAISQALAMKLPLMGVCGGMQRINVLLGGTLNQNISGEIEHDQEKLGLPGVVPVEYIKLEEGTRLAQMAGGIKGVYAPGNTEKLPDIVMENSFHHQAVDKLGKGLKVAARSVDGVIEAIEPQEGGMLSDQFIIGTQWHPEFGASKMGERIVSQVVDHARQFAQAQQQEASPRPSMAAQFRQRSAPQQLAL